jgi:threonine/homoserine/homoserine lactone efflux protein
MLSYVLIGAGLAFAAAIQPGPLQAFLLSRVATTGWRRTLPACLAPLISDGPIAVVALLFLAQLPLVAQHFLRAAGGGLLLYLAWGALRHWRKPPPAESRASSPRTVLQAALVNVLNPNPYLGWAFVLGPAILSAWRDRPSAAVALLLAFYGTMVAMLAAQIVLVGTSRFLGPRAQKALVGISAFVLAGLGIFLLGSGTLRIVSDVGSAGAGRAAMSALLPPPWIPIVAGQPAEIA